MADISKITLPSNTTYDIKDATARQSVEGKQDAITANGILQGDGSGNITAAASSTASTLNNPSNDGTYVLQNTVSSGASTLAWGTGGSSTDENVKQTASTPSSYTYWRPLLVGSSSNATEGFSPSTTTAGSYTFSTIEAQPSSGTIRMGQASMYNGSYTSKISPTTLTANRTITLPNASGTMALTSDIPDVSEKIDTAGTGLSKSGTTLNHSNSVTAQTTQAVYPIKIDAQGHISEYGSAVTIPEGLPSQTGNSGKFLTTNGSAASWADLPEDVFIATYGTTTWADISAAYAAGKSVVCKDDSNSGICIPMVVFREQDIAVFSGIAPDGTNGALLAFFLDNESFWTSIDVELQGALTAGADYITPPSSPSSGDVLTYNGTTWTASTPASGLPSQTGNSGKFLTTNGSAASWTTITQDDHKWGGVSLAASGANISNDTYVPSVESMGNTSGEANWAKVTHTPTNYCIAKYDGNAYLYSTTPASSDNSTKVATTAYVTTAVSGVSVPQASTTTPSMDGTASYGSGTTWARADHVHPTDTSRQATITASGILEGDGTGTITAADTSATSTLSIDTTVTAASNHLITSGAVATAISNIDALPSQTGNSGKYLTTNGTTASWGTVNTLPSQTGNSGKYLTTNGSEASWAATSATSAVTIDNTPTSNSSNVVKSGGVYTAINNKVNRTTAVNVADTNYTTLMARGAILLDSTTYDAVTNWSTYLVNGSIAWRYE